MTHVRLIDALQELVFEPDSRIPLSDVMDKYFHADYTHRSEGATRSRSEFEAMVAHARTQIVGGRGVVVDEMMMDGSYAERHRFRAVYTNGTIQRREIAVFGMTGEDGRFVHLSEIGFAISDEEMVL
jgi:hypothetical protein